MYKKLTAIGVLIVGCALGIMVPQYGHAAEQEYTEADMKAVTVRFCGEETGASTHDGIIYIEPGQEKNLCLIVQNRGDKEVQFEYGFSESTITLGRICQADMGPENAFSVLIPQTRERKVLIGPMSAKTIEEKVVIPPGMSGTQLGCMVYKLTKPEYTNVGGMFSLIIRKYGYLDIVVGGEVDAISKVKLLDVSGGLFSTNKKIKAEIDKENVLKLSFSVANEGNVTQSVTFTGKIYNALGFQKDFLIDVKKIAPGSSNEFTTEVGILPVYKGLFTVKFTMNNSPVFLFPVTNEDLKKPGYITEKGKIFAFSRILLAVVIVLLLILYKIIVPRRSRRVKTPPPVEQPTTQSLQQVIQEPNTQPTVQP